MHVAVKGCEICRAGCTEVCHERVLLNGCSEMSHRQNEVMCEEECKEAAVALGLKKCGRYRIMCLGVQVSLWRKLVSVERLFCNFKLWSGNRQDVELYGQVVCCGKRFLVFFYLSCILFPILSWPTVETYSPVNVGCELWSLYENVCTLW